MPRRGCYRADCCDRIRAAWLKRCDTEPKQDMEGLPPTLLTAVKLPPTPQMSGLNLLDEQALAARKAIFGECYLQDSLEPDNPAASLRWRWMIEGNWKLIIPDPHNRPNDRVELYDLASDPFEEHNSADSHGEIVQTMSKTLNAWWAGSAAK
jgi:uncharacterized sulfatase